MAPRGFDIPQYFTPTLDYIAERERVDPSLFNSLVQQESGFNPFAVSSAGAKGLGQLMDGTARDLGVQDVFNPVENAFGSARYLRQQLDAFGNEQDALTAYNWGPGNTKKWLRNTGGDTGSLPGETRNYRSKILGEQLPATPNIRTGYSSDTIPTYSRRREDNLDRVNTELRGLEGQQQEALEGLRKEGSLDSTEAIGVALSAILPALLGWGFGGSKGAAIGAEAGAAGANVGLQNATAQLNRRDNLNKTILNTTQQQIASREAERRGIENNMASAEEMGERQAFNADAWMDRAGLRGGPQQFAPEVAEAISAYIAGRATPEQETLLSSNPGALKVANDSLRAKTYSQGGGRYSDLAAQGLADVSAGREPSPEAIAEIMRNPRAVTALEQMKRREESVSRTNANLELRGRIPQPELAKITGHEVAINNYKELANLVRGRDFDTQRVGDIFGEFQQELLKQGDKTFTASGYDGIFNRVLASSRLDPNSYDYQVLMRMAQIGRANAIAQPGVATNQDAEAETQFVSIAPGQTVDSYIESLMRQANSRSMDIGVRLDNLSTNGYAAADEFKKKYLDSGLIASPKQASGSGAGGGNSLREEAKAFAREAMERGLTKEQAKAKWEARR
jgi:hypothetical protein